MVLLNVDTSSLRVLNALVPGSKIAVGVRFVLVLMKPLNELRVVSPYKDAFQTSSHEEAAL